MQNHVHSGLAPRFILASGSEARKSMLNKAGLKFSVISADIDESMIKQQYQDQDIAQCATMLACEKAKKVSLMEMGAIVIGADSMLEINGTRLSKPVGLDGLRNHLKQLRGNSHYLISAAAIYQDGMLQGSVMGRARLTMRDFSDEFLAHYIAQVGIDVCASVGGYQLEGMGAQLFDNVEGDYFTILGLPLFKLCALMRHKGWLKI
ncbi:MAG: nucleoside triphosphate pyrophosphatase [Alphaproteobacteria bacterium]